MSDVNKLLMQAVNALLVSQDDSDAAVMASKDLIDE